MLLLISKYPQFTDGGEVVLGQCMPYTSGWRLRLFDDGREEVLLTGTYYDLRRAQEAMAGKSDEEMRRIAAEVGREMARAAEMAGMTGGRHPAFSEESTAVLFTDEVKAAIKDEHQRAQAVAQFQGGVGPQGGFVRVANRDGVLVAALSGGKFLNAPESVGADIERALSLAPRGIVLDMDEVQVISTGGIRELVRMADLCSGHQVPMMVANLVSGIRKVLEMASLENYLQIHESVDAAVAAVRNIAPRAAEPAAGADA